MCAQNHFGVGNSRKRARKLVGTVTQTADQYRRRLTELHAPRRKINQNFRGFFRIFCAFELVVERAQEEVIRSGLDQSTLEFLSLLLTGECCVKRGSNEFVCALAVIATLAIFRFKVGVIPVILASGLLGMGRQLLT